MASLLLGSPNSLPADLRTPDGKRKKIPKVAVYVAGAAFAITTGLTVLIIPYVRQAAKLTNRTQFLSHRSQALLDARLKIPRAALPAASGTSSSSNPVPSSSSSSASHCPATLSTTSLSSSALNTLSPHPEAQDPILLGSRSFNNAEEKALYGASLTPEEGEEGSHEPVSGLLGFQALGIATALVFGSAGLGAFIVAKLMGVKDMTEFSSKMRESLFLSMPSLVSSVNQPGRSVDGFDGQAIEEWVAQLEKDDEAKEARPA
ncbi:uncharacterized protein I303_106959 [Kwoniella dejecticola CBS 10117]|uniref:Transmembrane protein 242 n=1 Tax=Kwoniella dejecticola CBS 10117 TaxID=1296121 RepID=A0A1A5ZYE0_9TREE|nr:uncharacterized protein I303_06360 [Kwoniella dejecticola CBS 10117]OBR82803.1 hypothetical protein I303_06360 [Kwoniella dejecticola CBS 10117]